MQFLSKSFSFITLFLISIGTQALPINFGKPVKITVSKNTNGIALSNSLKTVYVEHFNFTNEQKAHLSARSNNSLALQKAPFMYRDLPAVKQLGMNGVPVLDQGMHGSCVTFANTAAIDALLGRGDYISQLCQLSLGQYFEEHSENYLSGWNGSYGHLVLNQIDEFGFIAKDKESEVLCGGLSSYPSDDVVGQAMALEKFSSLKDIQGAMFMVHPLLSVTDSILNSKNMQATLYQVKKSIAAGDRVTIGFLLDVANGAGAEGQYHVPGDTWVLTQKILKHLQLGTVDAGHEVIITGYDDNALVTDEDGALHHGIFTLRNSWSDSVGDDGDYYMSYDYFMIMALEAQRIVQYP